jgi:hypothetical protein
MTINIISVGTLTSIECEHTWRYSTNMEDEWR